MSNFTGHVIHFAQPTGGPIPMPAINEINGQKQWQQMIPRDLPLILPSPSIYQALCSITNDEFYPTEIKLAQNPPQKTIGVYWISDHVLVVTQGCHP